MATETLDDFDLTPAWTEITATVAEAVSVDLLLQNVEPGAVAVVFGGAGQPTNKSGVVLGPRDSVAGNSDHVWARSLDASGKIGITLTNA